MKPRSSPLSAERSYILPMALFLALTQIGLWWPGSAAIVYPVKTVLTAVALWICWPAYTPIDWGKWKWGVLVGVLGVVEWVGGEKLLLHAVPGYPRLHTEPYDPMTSIINPQWRTMYIAFRWLGPTLVVPLMEERFWRDYLWRTIIAPNDFRLASIGEWDATAFSMVLIFFAGVHIQWVVALGWGAMIGWLLIKTKSLGACIVAHGVTNFLLGAYVLWTRDWYFW